MQFQDEQIDEFNSTLHDYFSKNGRGNLPWRLDTSPYAVFVSELMLQQTQVSRVIPKFNNWLEQFPDFRALAETSQSDVLRAWQGLGYNRRGRYAHQSAQLIMSKFGGKLPQTQHELEQLPGIGPNTAGAILAYAFNQPAVYIETNIRTVFIHHFFRANRKVDDKQLRPFIEAALDCSNPRQWYWALMDYGVHLKRTVGNSTQQSKHYVKQSQFEGSLRQLRATVLRTVLAAGSLTLVQIEQQHIDSRLEVALNGLVMDGLLQIMGDEYYG